MQLIMTDILRFLNYNIVLVHLKIDVKIITQRLHKILNLMEIMMEVLKKFMLGLKIKLEMFQ